MRSLLFIVALCISYQLASSQETKRIYLSGTDKDHSVYWGFNCGAGLNSNKDTVIAVPSNWELQGFGIYTYGQTKPDLNETGDYSFNFKSPDLSGGKTAQLVFEGVMTDAEVLINGKIAGPLHQGGFCQFKYPITTLLHAGLNLLQVKVKKTSANQSVNKAERKGDFWEFGGIYRPVYLEINPSEFIDRMAINARADGFFSAEIYAVNLQPGDQVEAQLQETSGKPFGKPFKAIADHSISGIVLKNQFIKPHLWSAEFPNLYQVVVTISNKAGIIHTLTEKFGFRTAELRLKDGFYLNGAKIIFKGCNRHSFWPESGRTLSHAVHVLDVNLMKEMNMNAVRMSHYPPDADFLSVCDSLGLYVLDELTGWQAAYDDSTGHRLVYELVRRDVNHPSIVIWDNGNEGGFNLNLDNDYGKYDPQHRLVIHPWAYFNGTNTKHYPDYKYVQHSVETDQAIFFPTEFMHGLYDGGAGAGLNDFWELMSRHPHGAGGFIWSFLDEAVRRTDRHGEYDTDGNHAPDGIVGPHREKEASFFTIKEIWSPIFVNRPEINSDFRGRLNIENRYSFTNLSSCTFKWKLVNYKIGAANHPVEVIQNKGIVKGLSLEPGKKGHLNLNIDALALRSDMLQVTALDAKQQEVCTWSWLLKSPDLKPTIQSPKYKPLANIKSQVFTASVKAGKLIITDNRLIYKIDTQTGYLDEIRSAGTYISLSGGPALAGDTSKLRVLNFNKQRHTINVYTNYKGNAALKLHWIFNQGAPVKIEYQYKLNPEYDYSGISFNYPETKVTGAEWLGRGPYRVWKNRLKGLRYNYWQKMYNNGITGQNWIYPEFKGYYADVNWIRIKTTELPILFYTQDKGQYFQLFKPDRAKDSPASDNVEPPFPNAGFSFLNAIPAIGTKFQAAAELGPESQKNKSDEQIFSGSFWLKIAE